MRYTTRPISDRTRFTGKHQRSPFQSSLTATLDLLDRELRAVNGRDVVLEVDVEERHIRLDGQLYANARPASPGVRLVFESTHGPLTYATDRFTTWQDNLRAIALGLEALRKVARYGIADSGEQYAGWKALPAGRAMPASHMTTTEARDTIERISGHRPGLPGGESEDRAVRRAKAAAHPDRNDGDRALWDQVEQAAAVLGVDR